MSLFLFFKVKSPKIVGGTDIREARLSRFEPISFFGSKLKKVSKRDILSRKTRSVRYLGKTGSKSFFMLESSAEVKIRY